MNKLQAAVQGEITPGSMIVVDPATALKAAMDNPPFAWTIHAMTQYLIKNYEDFNHKLELTGLLQKFSTSAIPTKFPSKSSQISELHTWEANFKEFCEKHCPEAYGIWDTCKIRYPVIPNALTLAKLLQEHGLTEKGYVTESEIETCLNSWIKSKLVYSTLNRNYSDTIAWLIAQIRSASKGVEFLENNIKAIQNGDIAEMKSVVYLHYQELDEFMKMVYVRGLDSIEVKKDRTLRRFYHLLIRILLALQRLGISVPLKNQKFIYLYSAYLIYGDKGFQGTSREWLLNDKMDLPKCKESYEFQISKSHIDPDFSWTYKGVSDSNKRAKVLPAEALEKLGDSIYPIESDNTKSSDKATEESANYTVKKINRLPCTHPACNKYGKLNHTNESCYIRHLDLCPDELKDKFQKIVRNYKNNRKPGNKRSYERGHSEAKGSKGKDMGEYLKKAYLTLVKKDKGNHDGQSDLSSNGDLVFALTMQNYNKAHKLKFKATKKQQKMLRQLDGDSDYKSNSPSKDKDSNKNNKSQGKKGNKNSGKKGKCPKCGKWGSHTAEECTSEESPKKTEEANLATTGNNGSPGRTVQKISGSRYIEDSDNEEDCLYLHEENRIKAMDVSGKDYAFYANYSRRAQASELREGFTQVIGRVKDTESDTDSVASGHVSAYFAAARGKVRDEDDDDDDGSVVTDDTSDQESTVHDDQLRPRSAAKDVSRLTTYRGE